MQSMIKYFLISIFMVVVVSEAFFIQSKDIKRMLRLFPKAFEVETTPKTRPFRYRHRDEPNNYDYNTHDNYDRQDHGEGPKNSFRKGKINGRYVYIYDKKPSFVHSHENCDHPDHYHQHHQKKYSEDRVEKHQYNNKKNNNNYKDNEETSDYYDRKSNYPPKEENYQQNNKKISLEEKEEDLNNNKNYNQNNKKDYVTGVLVTIPKIKSSEEDLGSYYKDSKQQNVFLQQLLKTEDDDDHHHHHHHIPVEDIKSYYY